MLEPLLGSTIVVRLSIVYSILTCVSVVSGYKCRNMKLKAFKLYTKGHIRFVRETHAVGELGTSAKVE